jgi:Fe-Mn family superoxide dismutase
MSIVLPPLPYAYDALSPFISRDALETHHGKHHRAYVEKTKALINDTKLANLPLETVMMRAARDAGLKPLLNQAAQAWNHAFFWRSLRPSGGGAPTGAVAERLRTDFGSYERFAERFASAAAAQFGSGWAWLVLDGEHLRVETSANADTPFLHGRRPLLVIDVWEHAYYLDYKHRRDTYVRAVIDHLLDWDFANANLTPVPQPQPSAA